ncbi:alpha-N-arabinofuranosidase [Granulicella tundricola]|uniref:non-reducing end alpha-L-arabinofuranosidase n=1 Tax=Granulicella tundricola (strain ATCC BAA-1859 / DSM 23138 / MP5ACTX9) TaxID=1198114 RepID=E8WVY7_GRATM|nr:alpha-L-arabinofuranosidase C-terminal domain-containing protein [Granulicella tundricola]ADW70746.1 alpha-L-arabinofuranosidase domain protein [Granulicella tundricola MP5ACTX9]
MNPDRRQFLRAAALTSSALALRASAGIGQLATSVDAHITILPAEPIGTIAPEIYGHFIEQLGGVIYDGVWVGEKSKIPNHHGVRQAFIDAMRAVKAPVLRWPGGCFADSYDWRDGIGPAEKRPQRTAFWTQEDSNRYGLHEFMTTCRAIGCEPYLAADVRSLPARDFYQWVEYCNAPSTPNLSGSLPGGINALAAERARNGSPEPFNVRYWGVGNEVWGCGGSQTAEEYGGEYRRYTEWIPRYGATDEQRRDSLRLIACGANGDDARWTAGVMKSISEHHKPFGFSTHYYTSGDAKKFAAGDALEFDPPTYYDTLARGAFMERIITDSWSALGETNHGHSVKIIMDEWGAWYSKSTELGPKYNLSQQSTMRDAILSGITLDIFHKHADKVAMANVAQTINCIHSLMLASEDKFTVTPTFHVFKMYMPHQGAQSLRVEFAAASIPNPIARVTPVGGNSADGSIDPASKLAGLSGSASIATTGNGKVMTLTVVNPHLDQPITTEIVIPGVTIASVTGEVLTAPDIHAHNDFTHPNAVHPEPAKLGTPSGGRLIHTFPPASVTALSLILA